jgi:hypothetical protein
VSARPSLLIIALLSAVACGPKSGPTGPKPVDVGAYPALAWVPGDATYVAVGVRVDAAIAGARDVLETMGIVGDFDVVQVEHEISGSLGFNPLSVDDLTTAGIDTAAGGVLYGQGFSPTFVFKLADPAAMQNRIDAQRDRVRNTIGVAIRDGIEVFTDLGNRDVHTHWAIDGSWMWVHFEIVDEHERELGWFESSRAANGVIAKDPDFAWARAQAEAVQPGTPFFGLVRPRTMAARLAQLARDDEATACMALITPPRAAFSIKVEAGVSEGHVLVDTGSGGAAIADATLKVPSGWAAAREGAALAAEWNIDARVAASYFTPCDRSPIRFVDMVGLRGIRGFITRLDVDTLEGQGAVAAEISNRAFIDKQLDITGRSMFEKKKKFGPLDGVHLEAPMFPAIDYILTSDRAMAALGDGVLAKLVGDGGTAPGVLAALDVRPSGLDDRTWDVALERLAGVSREGARANTIRRLKRWKRGTIELTLDGDLLHLHARGERP